MIRVDDVWKTYGGRPALRGATLHVDEGDAVLLTGASGSGKSTLLRLLYLEESPDRGALRLAGRSLVKLRASSVPYVRRNIGVVQQEPRLMRHRSVFENVAVAVEILGLPEREVRVRALSALTAVGLLADADQRVGSLPGGVQQRVAVARALIADPPILLCDEPTGYLDPLRTQELLELLRRVHGRGTTVLIATHDPAVLDFGAGHGWRQVTLHQGEVISGGLPARDQRALAAPLPPALPTLRLPQARREAVSAAPLGAIDAERSLEVSIEFEDPELMIEEGQT